MAATLAVHSDSDGGDDDDDDNNGEENGGARLRALRRRAASRRSRRSARVALDVAAAVRGEDKLTKKAEEQAAKVSKTAQFETHFVCLGNSTLALPSCFSSEVSDEFDDVYSTLGATNLCDALLALYCNAFGR